MQSSTQTISEQLLTANEDNKKHTHNHSLFRYSQRAHNLLNTFIKTGYTSAILLTDTLSLEPIFLQMSWAGMGVAMPIALYFSLCELWSHDAVTEHFDQAEHAPVEKDIESGEAIPLPSLTWKQWALVCGHFASDVFEGVEPLLFVAKMAGIDNIAKWQRGLSYAGMGLYSIFGKVQELKNTITAFREENKMRM